MLYKESAIAVMVAVMLAAASLFGGLAVPALATHDPDAVEIANEEISQEDDEHMIVDAVELTAKKSSSRSTGTLTIEVIQEGDALSSASLEVRSLQTSFTTFEVDIPAVNVTGDFEVLVEYEGSGTITASVTDVIEGTETEIAELPEEDPESPPSNEEEDPDAEQPEVDNVIETVALSLDDEEESATVDTVEFSAKKSSSRSTGTLVVALVQDGEVLDSEGIDTHTMQTSFMDFEVSFNEEVTDDFEVVFMYGGSGTISLTGINVPGTTETAGDGGSNGGEPDPDGMVVLTVESEDMAGNEITGMWVEVYNGMSASGETIYEGYTPTTVDLEAGPYVVAVGNFETNIFDHWADSAHDRTREADLTSDDTFTAVYNTDGSSPPTTPPTTPPDDPDDPDPPTTPPTSGPGSLTVFAHRVPSEHWGPTFTSASAGMWFVLYNSTAWIVHSGLTDENGSTITGLNDGETYYIYATGCDECHGSTHDVVFDHWGDNTTENPRAVTTGTDSHAWYRYDPDP